MADILHGSARTTPRIRAELQASQESTRSLAARHGLNPKTVKKWRSRTATADAPMGPKTPRSTVLTPAEEAIVVAFRQKTLLPLEQIPVKGGHIQRWRRSLFVLLMNLKWYVNSGKHFLCLLK